MPSTINKPIYSHRDQSPPFTSTPTSPSMNTTIIASTYRETSLSTVSDTDTDADMTDRPKRKRAQPSYAELDDSDDDSPVGIEAPKKKHKKDDGAENMSDIGTQKAPDVLDEGPKKGVVRGKKRANKTREPKRDQDEDEIQDKKAKKQARFSASMKCALAQPIYFVDRYRCDDGNAPQETFTILGNREKKYVVEIKRFSSCTCPDYKFRKSFCKHILYTLIKVLKVDEDSPLLSKRQLTHGEVRQIFDNAPPVPIDIVADDNEASDLNRKSVEGDCPICFMKLERNGEKIVYCKAHCGNNVHHRCMQTWLKSQQKTYSKRTCPYCRKDWVD